MRARWHRYTPTLFWLLLSPIRRPSSHQPSHTLSCTCHPHLLPRSLPVPPCHPCRKIDAEALQAIKAQRARLKAEGTDTLKVPPGMMTPPQRSISPPLASDATQVCVSVQMKDAHAHVLMVL